MYGGGILGFRPIGMRAGGMTEIDIPLNVLKYRKFLENWNEIASLGAPLTGNPPSEEDWQRMPQSTQDALFGQVQGMLQDRILEIEGSGQITEMPGLDQGAGAPAPDNAPPRTVGMPGPMGMPGPTGMPGIGQGTAMDAQALESLMEVGGPVAEPTSGYRHGGMLNRRRGY